MGGLVVAFALALGVVTASPSAHADNAADCANAATHTEQAGCVERVDKAFTSMLRNPATAEKTFRADNTLQGKIGLAMLLRLVEADPQQHDAEIRKVLGEIAADTSGDKEPIDFGKGYDGTVDSLVPYIQAAAGSVLLPCALIERHPPLIKVLAPYFFSSRDGALPSANCSEKEYPMPASVEAFIQSISAYDGGAFDRCTGTMRSGFARAAIMADVERQVLPRMLLADAAAAGNPPEWAKLDVLPLARWSYQSAWNRFTYLHLRDQFIKARADLAAYYRQRFGLAREESLHAAHLGLWNGIADWTWQVQPVPSPLVVAIMDKDAKPALAALLAENTPLGKLPEPALSLAVVRPAAIGLLLAAHADVNAKNAFGKTPLMTAAQFDQLDAVRRFIAAGAQVNAQTAAPSAIAGNNPAEAGNLDGVCGDYAIVHGNRTPLMYAAANASLPVIKALLAAGADKSLKDSRAQTALDYLQGNGPVPANPRLKGNDRAEAIKLLAD